jgi:hypothetical protein
LVLVGDLGLFWVVAVGRRLTIVLKLIVYLLNFLNLQRVDSFKLIQSARCLTLVSGKSEVVTDGSWVL